MARFITATKVAKSVTAQAAYTCRVLLTVLSSCAHDSGNTLIKLLAKGHAAFAALGDSNAVAENVIPHAPDIITKNKIVLQLVKSKLGL